MRHHQTGVTTVEFAIVGAVLFMVLFGIIEFGRALFIANALVESTRRGARVAAVCPVGDPRAAQVAIIAGDDGISSISSDLTTSNVEVSYLDQNGATLGNPGANFAAIAYVRVRVVNYQHQMMIPFVMPEFFMPAFVATLPIESLGYSPTQQAFLACPAV
jgi:Flp pilus assembly protein TadG